MRYAKSCQSMRWNSQLRYNACKVTRKLFWSRLVPGLSYDLSFNLLSEIIDKKKCIHFKAQIFSDEEYQCSHFLLWVGSIDPSKYKCFVGSPPQPLQMIANPDDVIQLRFSTEENHQYLIKGKEDKSFEASDFDLVKRINFLLRVDHGRYKIKDQFIDINCHIRINSLQEQLLPFRMKNLVKHGKCFL